MVVHYGLESRDAIATIQTDFPEMTLIYGYADTMDAVLAATGSAYVADRDYVGRKAPRTYKLYTVESGHYFAILRKRYYLHDATLTLAGQGW